MRKIVYYVACSLDGYISGANDDVSDFIQTGKGVERYRQDLDHFDTVIMGRKTYEFGYQFGLTKGKPAYPHMQHYIFSNSLHFENPHEMVHVEKMNISTVIELKNQSGKDIYLCGGGLFAGWLLDNGHIDIIKLKLNPIMLGQGIKLFGNSKTKAKFKHQSTEVFENEFQVLTYSK